MKSQGCLPEQPASPSHEGRDLEPRLILRVTAIILATLVVLVIMGLALFRIFEHEYPSRTSEAAPSVAANDLPPQPRLQMNPAVDLQTVRTRENDHLDRYAWTSPAHTAAQIPIERAMALWVQDYRPPVSPATNAAPPPGVTELQMRQEKAQEASHAP